MHSVTGKEASAAGETEAARERRETEGILEKKGEVDQSIREEVSTGKEGYFFSLSQKEQKICKNAEISKTQQEWCSACSEGWKDAVLTP